MIINFIVNDKKYSVDVDQSKRLLDVLREDLGLTGTKEGCAVGECGACTVIMDGEAVHSCLIMAGQLEGRKIETVENLEQNATLSRLQESFLKHGAVQCGFCTPGMLMSAKALLDKVSNPSLAQIEEALEGNACRCTGYKPIVDAIQNVDKV